MQPAYRDVTLAGSAVAFAPGCPRTLPTSSVFDTFYEDFREPDGTALCGNLRAALQEAPAGPVRADKSYSNTGYLLAGAAAEHATGRAFEAV
jgi:CubicO group peptidase (beta-lactamase class C family)